MVNSWKKLLISVRNKKRAGYILLTSILVLVVACTVIIWQYHYYSGQWKIENQLTQQFIRQARANLQHLN